MSNRIRKILLTGKKPKSRREKPKWTVEWFAPSALQDVYRLWKFREDLQAIILRCLGVPPDLAR